ncbi:MAG TPA: hypothetical protein VHC73_16380 [Vitreimonas sp.]|nr:hypothetical protein [Vitreimonas sp.]
MTTTIMHISLPADDTEKTAQVLAEIMNGEAARFPPGGPKAWKVFSGDGAVDLEVVQRGDLVAFAENEGGWKTTPNPQRTSECHMALCVDRPEAEVIEIAQRAGWTARHCERGGGIFGLAEIWVDNAFMIEVLDPVQSARYRENVTLAKWKQYLPMMLARTAAA